MITFVLYNQDQKESGAILDAMMDLEKAFNRQNGLKKLWLNK